jgi:hypothetical protein
VMYEYWRCSRRYCFSSTLGHSFMIYLLKVNNRTEEKGGKLRVTCLNIICGAFFASHTNTANKEREVKKEEKMKS